MPRHETLRQLGDIIGRKGDKTAPVLQELSRLGLENVNRTTIGRLRMGDTSGEKLKEKLNCSEILQSNNASNKDELYLLISLESNSYRTAQAEPLSHRLLSRGFTEGVAQTLGLDPQVLRKCFRAMRAETVAQDQQEPNGDLKAYFINTANAYLNAYTHPVARSRDNAQSIKESWNYQTLIDFYRLLYQFGKPTVGSWTPYEVEYFQRYYERQFTIGNPLSYFDKRILNAYIKAESEESLIQGVKEATGIKTDKHVVYVHRNALTHGSPTKT